MATKVHSDSGIQILSPEGELAGSAVRHFRQQARSLLEVNEREYVVDFSNTTAIDSGGLECLTWLASESKQRLGKLKLACLNPLFMKILTITRLAERFERFSTVDAAVESFG